MSRFLSAIVVIFVLGEVQHSAGYKWIAMKTGDPLPINTIILDRSLKTYVGRAQHFNLLLPAEVYNGSYARIYSCSKKIIKHHFEVLVASEKCDWKLFNNYDDVPETVVRAGYAWNGEPIFIGKTAYNQGNSYSYTGYNERVASIYLSTQNFVRWEGQEYNYSPYSLVCDDQNIWVDTSAVRIPNNTISGGKSEEDNDIFVARLLNDCNIVAGQVIPDLGISTAVDTNRNRLQSPLCQVLIGDPNDYSWIPASDGEIPDNAVVASKLNSELLYVARINKELGYIRYNNLGKDMDYEVLVRNVD